jgi:hypothetical protein
VGKKEWETILTNAPKLEDAITDLCAKTQFDPLMFVTLAYPWGERELVTSTGARKWQADILNEIGNHLKNKATRFTPIKIAVASGHGIGKSCLVGQIIHWGLSTHINTKIVVTASTEGQLRTKTFSEANKWIRLGINSHWFKPTATSIQVISAPAEWRADAIPWSENNTDAFQGLHNEGKRIILIFDEASGIADNVWEVAEGAMTDANTEIIWIAFGNPVRSSGRFRECFEGHKDSWIRRQIDSRTVEGVNKEYFEELIRQYGGEDDDRSRFRVRGLFPITAENQFISQVDALAAANRIPEASLYDPLVFGIDVARGGDETVICIRRGRDAKSVRWVKERTTDLIDLGNKIIRMMEHHKPDAVFIDAGGMGIGVIDYIRSLKHHVTPVQFGSSASNDGMYLDTTGNYFNKRAEMYCELRSWLKNGSIPSDGSLVKQLTQIEYRYKQKKGIDCILLESKDEMRSRGLDSPDEADALALTFAANVQKSDHTAAYENRGNAGHQSNYNPLDRTYIASDLGINRK